MAFAARNSVYIRNLSPQVTEDVIRETFATCDAIERVLFRSFQGRTTEFFAQLDFATSKGVLEAHQMSGTKLLGQPVEISVMDPGSKDMGRKMWNVQKSWESVPEDQEETTSTEPQGVQAEYFRRFKEAEEDKRLRTVHIAGLAKEATEEDVRVICKQFGQVEALRMDKDNDGESFALVEFKERGSAQVVKRQEKYLVEERVLVFTEAKTMVDTTTFAEQSVQFNQPAFDPTTMKVVLAYQCHLNPKLAKARVAALQIAGEEIPKELIDAANQHSKPEEEQPIVWEGRGEQSCPLGAKEDRKRTRDGRDLDLPREGRRRRRGSRDRRESDQLRSQSRKRRRQQGEVPDAKKIARQVAENLLSEDRQGEEEDEVEAVPNTELFVLGSSESYSYEWEGDEEEIEKAKAAHAAEKHRIKEARKAEAERKAEEQRKAEEERKAEELRKLEEERKEAELKAEEARREAEAAEAKQKEEEVALVRSSSQEYIQAAVLRRRLERLASKESITSQPTGKWVCASCGEDNKPERQRCNNCGGPAPWVPKSFEVDDAQSEASSSSSAPRKPPLSPKSVAESIPRSVADSPPRSIAGSSPRSIAESKAESIDDEPGDIVALSESEDVDEVQLESERIRGELAEARARIFHSSE